MGAIGWRAWTVGALGVLQSAALVAGGGEAPAAQLLAVLLAAVLGSAALAWVALDRRFASTPVAWVFGLALLLRLIAIQAEPLLEDDHYRYLWDGMRTALHFDPYRLAPSAYFAVPDLAPRWQEILSGINNPDVPTIYGPVLQALFALAHALAPGRIVAIQGLLLGVDMACLALLARTLAHTGLGVRWLLAYALHPMILKEAMASAHPDGLVALWLLLALLNWQRGRVVLAGKVPTGMVPTGMVLPGMVLTGTLLGLAVATKVAALVAVPLFLFSPQRTAAFWPAARAMALGFVAALGLAYLPFLLAGGTDAVGLATFAAQWRFNPLLFRFIEAVLPGGLARPAAALLIVTGVAALAWRWRSKLASRTAGGDADADAGTTAAAALPPVGNALLLLIVLAPVVNPWYALWALAPALAARQPVAAVLGCVGVLAYLNASVLHDAGWLQGPAGAAPFAVAWPVTLVQMAVLAVALIGALIGVQRIPSSHSCKIKHAEPTDPIQPPTPCHPRHTNRIP